jgi:hypothetical protein
MLVTDMTHDDIADFCALRLRKMGYRFSCSNMTSASHGEQPDVLGISDIGESILVEVKVSRADFFADKKKPWRENPEDGMGDYRVYVTPRGLLKPEEIPYGWMLWEVHGKTRPTLKVIKGRSKKQIQHPYMSAGSMVTEWNFVNCDLKEYKHFKKDIYEKRFQKELTWMVKIMNRAIESGFEPNNYANCYQSAEEK